MKLLSPSAILHSSSAICCCELLQLSTHRLQLWWCRMLRGQSSLCVKQQPVLNICLETTQLLCKWCLQSSLIEQALKTFQLLVGSLGIECPKAECTIDDQTCRVALSHLLGITKCRAQHRNATSHLQSMLQLHQGQT